MLCLDFELLTGRYVATAYNDRRRAEWPPHPARVFSALVATALEVDAPDDDELAALRWLEAQPPPRIAASEAAARDVVTVFVPVNDTTVTSDKHVGLPKKAPSATDVANKIGVLPAHRTRQPRSFPSVTPETPRFSLIWPDADPGAHGAALDRLARRVVRVGHSSSLVAGRVSPDAPAPTWRPADAGPLTLRSTDQGQLARLQEDFAVHRATDPRVLPARHQPYDRVSEGAEPLAIASSCFGQDWVVLRRVGGVRLPILAAVTLAQAVRGAVMRHADDPVAEVISGHLPNGRPSPDPHLCFVPLPFVGREHADGHLLGIALVLPRDLDEDGRRAVWRAIGRWEEAHRVDGEDKPSLPARMGRAGVVELERVGWELPAHSLRPATWCRPARRWVSATPVALDRNPGQLASRTPAVAARAWRRAEETIARSCENIGLPVPRAVTLHPSPPLPGSARARQFGPFPRDKGRTRRVLVHAELHFDEPIRGPVLLGAGRFLGLGLFRPVEP